MLIKTLAAVAAGIPDAQGDHRHRTDGDVHGARHCVSRVVRSSPKVYTRARAMAGTRAPAQQGRDAGRHYAVLADEHRRFISTTLLGEQKQHVVCGRAEDLKNDFPTSTQAIEEHALAYARCADLQTQTATYLEYPHGGVSKPAKGGGTAVTHLVRQERVDGYHVPVGKTDGI